MWRAGGVVSPEATSDHEEKEQCIKMHEIIAQYKLEREFRYGGVKIQLMDIQICTCWQFFSM